MAGIGAARASAMTVLQRACPGSTFASEASLVSPHERSLHRSADHASTALSASSAARTSAAWPAALTVGQTRAIRPSGATRNVVRAVRPGAAAVLVLLDPRSVGLGRLVPLVGQEQERQLELLAEPALAGGALRADAPDVRAALVDRLVPVAELARLGRAAGRVVLGVEVQDGPAASLIGEAVDGAEFVGKGDLGCRVANGRHAHAESLAGDSTISSRPLRTRDRSRTPRHERSTGRAPVLRAAVRPAADRRDRPS